MKSYRAFNVLVFLLFYTLVHTQEKKTTEAINISTPLKIDGFLNEDSYKNAKPATNFVQLKPYNGKPCTQNSEVYFFYDQSAIYVGAMLYDNQPDSIYKYLSSRDDTGTSDYFGIYLDSYNEGQLAYGFFVTSAGVQTDIKAIKSDSDDEDDDWDAVWQSKTRITDNGWIVEMRIPYANLRFTEQEIHTWGLNMFRYISRHNSNNSWNFIDKKVHGFIHQQGELTGIQNIKPPTRLSFSPYFSAYAETDGESNSTEYLFKGGMDVKYGINESFTLDMMLIPDFGQIQSDDQQLNLSAYELYYDENRQFFTEGTELFERGDIFYSRRIGDTPIFSDDAEDNLNENEIVDYNPSSTRLANTSKLSGRTKKGWGFGILNAMSLPSYADIKDTITGIEREYKVQPFTNYNLLAIDKALKNNSYISLINSNMTMRNNPFTANVSATEFQIRDKKKRFAMAGKGGFSYCKDETNEEENGGYAELELSKNNGSLTYSITQEFYSENYDPNDMGYLETNNRLNSEAEIEYAIIEPFSIFREWYVGVNWEYERIVEPADKISNEAYLWTYCSYKNNSVSNMYIGFVSDQNDYDETRVSGRYFYKPSHIYYNAYAQSNSKKKIYFCGQIGGYNYPSTDKNGRWYGLGIDARIGQKFRFEYDLDFDDDYNDIGYVANSDDEQDIYFGKRNVKEVENEIEIDYIFSNKVSLAFSGRHYWSGVKYKSFGLLQQDGLLVTDATYTENHDSNYNIFNIDMMLTWLFAPGSEISASWKNEIFEDTETAVYGFNNNFKSTFNSPATNTLSIKILYYIDYFSTKQKLKKM